MIYRKINKIWMGGIGVSFQKKRKKDWKENLVLEGKSVGLRRYEKENNIE
jgi:hypothetical protein